MDTLDTLDTSSSSDNDDDDVLAFVAECLYQKYFTKRLPKKLRLAPILAGASYVAEVLQGCSDQCFETFRMSKDVFIRLRNKLQEKGKLRDTAGVGVDEQLAIFLDTVGHNVRCRVLQEKYQHSGETISRHFNSVLNAIIALKDEYIRLPEAIISPVLRFNKSFYPYFKNCLGVIDGTHIPAMVKKEDQASYLNRKGFLSQNVMAVVSFDRTFSFVAAGWVGSMTDMKVLRSAVELDGFKVPEGKFYLVDSKYANLPNFIAPYQGPCHHLGRFQAKKTYNGPTEIFNHRHAQLRDAAKRTFAVLKERFPILKLASPYPYATQVKLVIAACVIHNFIRLEQMEDSLFDLYDRENFVIDSDSEDEQEDPNIDVQDADRSAGEKIRREISDLLWAAS